MESKYDRVSYPENVYLHSDAETEDCGTGVYPGVSVISHRKFRNDTFKIACIKVRRKHRTLVMISLACLVLFLFLLVVIPIVARTSTGEHLVGCARFKSDYNSNEKQYGLFFQPQVEQSSMICYNKDDTQSWLKYVSLLDYHTNHYSFISQTTEEGYVDCTNKTAPAGKKCRFDIGHFGKDCSHGNHYGYIERRPCVMLTLKLPETEIVSTFDDNDADVKKKLGKRFSPKHIGVTCDGERAEDRKHLIRVKTDVERGGRLEDPIDITPPTGFPVTYFSNAQPTVPAVMVGFNNIGYIEKPIRIKCVAWAESFNNGHPESSPKYTSFFSIMFV